MTNRVEHFNLDNELIHTKSFENILMYDIPYRTLIGPKPFHIRFNKADGFITYDGTRDLVLLGAEKHDSIYSSIRYLIGVKSGVIYVTCHNYEKFTIDSFDSLPLVVGWLNSK